MKLHVHPLATELIAITVFLSLPAVVVLLTTLQRYLGNQEDDLWTLDFHLRCVGVGVRRVWVCVCEGEERLGV